MPRENLSILGGGRAVALDGLKSDTVDLAVDGESIVTKAVWVGVGGDIAFVPYAQDGSVTYIGAVTGSKIVMAAKRIMSTGTTATGLIADYDSPGDF